jgi:hypothetical protein
VDVLSFFEKAREIDNVTANEMLRRGVYKKGIINYTIKTTNTEYKIFPDVEVTITTDYPIEYKKK